MGHRYGLVWWGRRNRLGPVAGSGRRQRNHLGLVVGSGRRQYPCHSENTIIPIRQMKLHNNCINIVDQTCRLDIKNSSVSHRFKRKNKITETMKVASGDGRWVLSRTGRNDSEAETSSSGGKSLASKCLANITDGSKTGGWNKIRNILNNGTFEIIKHRGFIIYMYFYFRYCVTAYNCL